MAIKVSGTTVIDNSKNLTNVASIGFADGSSLTNSTLSDAAYVTTDNVGGQLLHTLDNPNAYSTSASDFFGHSASISGNYAIVGAHGEDDSSGAFSGKAYIFNVTTGALVHTLDNPNAYNTSANDTFGLSAAISGNYAIVGAYQEDDSSGTTSGKAYIFNVTTGELVHTLNNPNPYGASTSDLFGYSVAISGNYCIVGAYGEDNSSSGAESNYPGKAYIFNVTTGALVHTLDNPNAYSGASTSDTFGFSVAIDGNYAIVGAHQEDDSGGTDSGKAYIFNVTTGALVHTLDNPNAYDTSAFDRFGHSLSISGNYAIVGAYSEDDSGGSASGKAYIFNVTTGTLVHTLDNPNAYDTSASDYFGYAVAISGNYAIVGTYFEDDAGGTDSGKAYIYNVTTGALVRTLDNPNAYDTSGSDRFGWSVSISGNYAIVSAYLEDDSGGTNSGKAYIFNVDNSLSISQINSIRFTHGNALEASHPIFDQAYVGGQLINTLDNPNAYSTSTSDFFGYSVAISGNYAIVGADGEDGGGNNSGNAYIFNMTTGALVHTLDNPNADGSAGNDRFGTKVAISGNYAFIAATREDDTPSGKTDVGIVYIFNVTTGLLVDTIFTPFTPTTTKYYFGEVMDVSGNYCIIGEDLNDEAYVYKTTTGDWTDTTLLHTLTIASPANFGVSVAISGNYTIVGDSTQSDSGGASSGKAYIFNVTTGALVHTLDNPNAYNTSAGDVFGYAVSISGNYAIVGAYGEDDSGGTESGKAYIFNVTTGALVHTLDNPNAYDTSANDSFGRSVAISGNYAIVGAYFEDDSGGLSSGKAYIFNVTTGALVYTLDNPNPYGTSTSDYFGYSVAISGNYAIVGAYFEDDSGGTSSGKAYMFAVDNMTYLDKAAQLVLE